MATYRIKRFSSNRDFFLNVAKKDFSGLFGKYKEAKLIKRYKQTVSNPEKFTFVPEKYRTDEAMKVKHGRSLIKKVHDPLEVKAAKKDLKNMGKDFEPHLNNNNISEIQAGIFT